MPAPPTPRRLAPALALTLTLALAAGPAHAREWETQDSVGGSASALMGGIVGLLGGALAGGILGLIPLATRDRPRPTSPGEPPPRSIDHSGMIPMIGMFLGGVVGGVLGAPTGVWLYGDSRDFDGSWLASVGGGLGGAVVGGGLGYLLDDGTWVAVGIIGGLLAGSVAGYALTAGDNNVGAVAMPLTLGGTF